MPKFTLEISAQLDNISSLSYPADYPWHITLGCGNCGEKTPKPVVISSADQVEGIRGAMVNMKISCKLCARVNDVTISSEQHVYTYDDSPEWKPFMHLECRGTQPLDISLADDIPLKIVGMTGFQFDLAFITDAEFYSYDEKENTEASITEFTTRIVKG